VYQSKVTDVCLRSCEIDKFVLTDMYYIAVIYNFRSERIWTSYGVRRNYLTFIVPHDAVSKYEA